MTDVQQFFRGIDRLSAAFARIEKETLISDISFDRPQKRFFFKRRFSLPCRHGIRKRLIHRRKRQFFVTQRKTILCDFYAFVFLDEIGIQIAFDPCVKIVLFAPRAPLFSFAQPINIGMKNRISRIMRDIPRDIRTYAAVTLLHASQKRTKNPVNIAAMKIFPEIFFTTRHIIKVKDITSLRAEIIFGQVSYTFFYVFRKRLADLFRQDLMRNRRRHPHTTFAD